MVEAFSRLTFSSTKQNSIAHCSSRKPRMVSRTAAKVPTINWVPGGAGGFFLQNHRRVSTVRISPHFATTVDDNEVETDDESKAVDDLWDIPILKKNVIKLVSRTHKKIGKANSRLSKVREIVDRLTSDENATLEELEQCPNNLDELELHVQELKSRLRKLNALEEALATQNSKKSVVLPEDIATLAIDSGVDDQPPKPKPPRGRGKKKGPRPKEVGPRLPYRRYFSCHQNVEIRVGKQAADNDDLTMSPEHRDGSDWWMHSAGTPGSHVVIRCTAESLDEKLVMDAAALAARQSKATGTVIKVSMTRCRDIRKPSGVKPGTVQLVGKVRTISVNMKEAEKRLKRLDDTVMIN